MKNFLRPFLLLPFLLLCCSNATAQTITITDNAGCFNSFEVYLAGMHDGKNYYNNVGRAISLYWDAGDARWETDGNQIPGQNTFVIWVNSADTPIPPGLEYGGWTDASGLCGTLIEMSGDVFVALPVELVSFTARSSAKNVVLTWQTASETGSEKFEVETSRDGQRFQKIGEMAAQGTTTLQQDYSFRINEPGAGTTYYRLKQMDLDGAYTYSGVISNDFGGTAERFGNFFPNPSKSGRVDVFFDSEAADDLQITVFDAMGKRVADQKHQVSAGANAIECDFSSLTAGVYLVKLGNAAASATRKLIIN